MNSIFNSGVKRPVRCSCGGGIDKDLLLGAPATDTLWLSIWQLFPLRSVDEVGRELSV